MSGGRLTVCATPIGNLGDITQRVSDALVSADVVYAEDTRRASTLLRHVGSDARVRSLFKGNEMARTGELLDDVRAGLSVALVSDAGMPGVSDPGAAAVSAALDEGLSVTVLPGPSAVTTAIALSGFEGDRFVFEGFMPRKGKERASLLSALAREVRPVVLFASPKRVGSDLADLAEALGDDREVAVLRELTKLHEEIWKGPLGDAIDAWKGDQRGEFTLVVGPGRSAAPSLDAAADMARVLVSEGVSTSDAARKAAAETGLSRREIYEELIS